MLVVAALVTGVNKPPSNMAHRDALLARSTLEPGGDVWIELYTQENLFGCFHGAIIKHG